MLDPLPTYNLNRRDFCANEDALSSCCGLSPQQVPSPSNTLSPIPHAHSPTMFSPGGGGGGGGNGDNCKANTATTTSSAGAAKYSPYAEAASRTAGGRRLSSAASTASTSSSVVTAHAQPPPQLSLLESLAEFNALQNRIKVERESVAPPPPPSYAESTKVKAESGECRVA